MELEHKAETLQPQPGAGVAVKVADILAVDQHGPAGGAVQKAEQIEQRRLAAARGTDDRREASPFDDEVRVLHKKHRRLSRQGAAEVAGLQQAHNAPRTMSTGTAREVFSTGSQAATAHDGRWAARATGELREPRTKEDRGASPAVGK